MASKGPTIYKLPKNPFNHTQGSTDTVQPYPTYLKTYVTIFKGPLMASKGTNHMQTTQKPVYHTQGTNDRVQGYGYIKLGYSGFAIMVNTIPNLGPKLVMDPNGWKSFDCLDCGKKIFEKVPLNESNQMKSFERIHSIVPITSSSKSFDFFYFAINFIWDTLSWIPRNPTKIFIRKLCSQVPNWLCSSNDYCTR